MKTSMFTRLSRITLLLIMFGYSVAKAQDCAYWPAPCPHADEITNATDFVNRGQDNHVLPQEIAMESNVRNALTDILQKMIRAKHWSMYELNESSYDRPNSFIAYTQWEATPYEKRPPHAYEICYIIIVNKDSLKTWGDWYKNGLQAQSNQVVSDMKSDMSAQNNDQQLKAYMDSAQYYTQLRIAYMQNHNAQYTRDLQSGNKKATQAYEKKVAWYSGRTDEFIKKYQDLANGLSANSTNSYQDLQKQQIINTDRFANASLILVHFAVNVSQAGTGATDGDQKCFIPQRKLSVPGAFYAGLLHNPNELDNHSYDVGEADFTYPNPSNIATVLWGKWLPKRDSYNYMRSAFSAVPADNDLTSLKKLKCDTVQNMVMHLEGRPDYIQEVLKGVDIAALQKLVTVSQ
ncbi:MAG TPA: hypothetical protein VHC47_02940 [Mucilaginibacter sp.]|nr:hypothetical protein [Mucilaginibacter sp.]